MKKRLRVFTWHIHESYLHYLSQGNYDLLIPYDPTRGEGFLGRGRFPFGENVIEVPVDQIASIEFDVILFQSQKNFLVDQHELFSDEQHRIPKVFLEHQPPRASPSGTTHVVDDPEVTLVHVTHFNKLMWNCNRTPSVVIEHGVPEASSAYSGRVAKGIVVVNNIVKHGRQLGLDIFREVQREVPLDLVGTGAVDAGGLGELQMSQVPQFIGKYRFFFNPVRYASLSLSVCEAMMAGMPVVGIATTEMVTVVENGKSGFLHTDVREVVRAMKALLADPGLAKEWGCAARETALRRFNIKRFTADWDVLFASVVKEKSHLRSTMIAP